MRRHVRAEEVIPKPTPAAQTLCQMQPFKMQLQCVRMDYDGLGNWAADFPFA